MFAFYFSFICIYKKKNVWPVLMNDDVNIGVNFLLM